MFFTNRFFLMAALLGALFLSGLASAETPLQPGKLLCEYRVNPEGIDAVPPRLSWTLEADYRGARQWAYQILVASTEAALAKDQGDVWDSGQMTSPENVLRPYAGAPLVSRQRCFWKVRVWSAADHAAPGPWSSVARWSMGLLNNADWQGKYVGMSATNGDPKFPWLRTTFAMDSVPTDARVYVNSLGYYELYINGTKVDDHPFAPAATQLSQRSYYLVHDVAAYLKPGKNSVALWLGRGWYLPELPGVTHDGPVVRAQLEITGSDGKTQTVATGADWKAHASHIAAIDEGKSGHYGGERVDMTQYEPRWADPGYDDAAWPAAEAVEIPAHTVCAQRVGPNQVQKKFTPRVIRPFGEKAWLVDFGASLTGSFEFKFKAPKLGDEITFDYYDRVVEGIELRNFSQHDVYVSKGVEDACFATHFNYHAFRYVKITGLDAPPREEDLSAALIYSDIEPLASFACSNPMLTDIHDMVFYTLRCLSLGGFLVDCPHIERLGYGGDGQASTPTALTMFNLGAMYNGWTEDWRDSQREDGDMPHTAPNPWNAGGGPFWCTFIIGAPWYMSTLYNDDRILEANYPAMQRWLDGWVEGRCKDDLLMGWENKPYRNWYLGDWAQPGRTEKEREKSTHLVANCVRIQSYDFMAKIAARLGKPEDAKRYQAKADSLRPKVHAAFYDAAQGTYADDTQIDLAYPLLTGVVPEALREGVLKRLEDDILIKRKGHLDVGLVGVPVLVDCLLKYDRSDLLFAAMNTDTFPGYGYMLANDATTTWEHWDGDRSHIHNCYNGIGTWFYRGLAGILPDPDRGYRHPILRPAIMGDVTWAQARQDTVAGAVASHWRIKDGQFLWDIQIPPGAESATVMIPAQRVEDVKESGKAVGESPGVVSKGQQGRYAVFEVPSGKYSFSAPKP